MGGVEMRLEDIKGIKAIVEGIQWNGDNIDKVLCFVEVPMDYNPFNKILTLRFNEEEELKEVLVRVGDYIIKDKHGCHRVFKSGELKNKLKGVGIVFK